MSTNFDLLTMMHDAWENGGGTYRIISFDQGFLEVEPVEHKFGYYVSEPLGIENLPLLYPDVLRDFIVERITMGTGGYLGLWRDENDNWSVDVSHWYNSLDEAMWHGKNNKQRAIFSLNSMSEVILEEVSPM